MDLDVWRWLRDFHLPAVGAALISVAFPRSSTPTQSFARRALSSAQGIAIALLYLFWKIRQSPCTNCDHTMAGRKPSTINQKLSGNFSCPSCGCEFNAYGCILHA
jgi:hypothetical protein